MPAILPSRRLPPELAVVLPTPWPGAHLTRLCSGRSYPRHWHDGFGIGLIEAGGQRSASGRGPVEGLAGDIITVNPGEVHDGHALGDRPRRWSMIYLPPELLRDGCELSDSGAELVRPVLQDPTLTVSLRLLLQRVDVATAMAGDAVTHLACDEALAQFFRSLRPHCSEVVRPEPETADAAAIERVRSRLADDPQHAPTLAELAQDAGLSRFQLLRHFRHRHGLPPHAWLLQARIHRARRHIAAGDSLAGAAAAAGFADQSHMTRAFSRHCGYTPGAWRDAQLRR